MRCRRGSRSGVGRERRQRHVGAHRSGHESSHATDLGRSRRVRGGCRIRRAVGGELRDGALLRVDLRTYSRPPHPCRRLAVRRDRRGGRVWTTVWGAGVLAEVDPAKARVVRRIAVGAYPTGLLYRDGSLWVGFGREATEVARVDAASGRVARVAVGVKAPSHFLATASAIWVVNDGDTIVRLDPKTGAVLGTTHVRSYARPARGRAGRDDLGAGQGDRHGSSASIPATGRVLDSFRRKRRRVHRAPLVRVDVGDGLRGHADLALRALIRANQSSGRSAASTRWDGTRASLPGHSSRPRTTSPARTTASTRSATPAAAK